MKLEHLQQLVTKLAIIGSGILVAVLLGIWAGRGDKVHISVLLGTIAYALLFFKMRQHIWLLIPLLMPLSGKLGFLPLPFSAQQLGILIVFGSYLSLIAIKIVTMRPKYDLLDLILLINILYSATVYVRNPVGTLAIGSDRIGGRPYVDFIVGILGYWTLCHVVATPSQLTRIPYLMFAGTAFTTLLSFISTHIPSTAPILSKIYSGVDTSIFGDEQDQQEMGIEADPDAMIREQYYAPLANILATIVVSYNNPSQVINPFYFRKKLWTLKNAFLRLIPALWPLRLFSYATVWPFGAFMLSTVGMLLSGHRSGLVNIFAFFLMSSFLREKIGGFCRSVSVVLIVGTIFVLGNGTFYDLPLSAQRALSFLPGNWDPTAKGDAEGSTRWREEMWSRAMAGGIFGSSKYIKSKLLGDGPGFDKAEFANFQLKGAGNEGQQEDLMIAGGFHSGPVSTVRDVGYVGGILFYILMFYTAVRAYKLIVRARGTPYFPMALFVAMPMIWSPFSFTFVFGGFEGAFPSTMLSIGFIKMIDQSLTASNLIKVSSSAKAELRSSGSRPAPAFAGRPLAGSAQT
jgi:hypothetical protein